MKSQEAPDRPREVALEIEAKKAVDEIRESSLTVLTTFSNRGWLKRRLSEPGATNKSRLTDSAIGQDV